METSRLCVSGYIGPAIAPWIARNITSMPRLVERPQHNEAIENSIVAHTKVFTSPKRRDRNPVSGNAIALATVNEVITHTDWFWLAPRLPAIVGNETLAIVRSSTCMKVPSDRPIVASGRLAGRNSPNEAGWAGVEAIRRNLSDTDQRGWTRIRDKIYPPFPCQSASRTLPVTCVP